MKYRRKTISVHIGKVPMGSEFPIRLQSMTNTDTLNTKASVEQAMRIFDAGADYVRLTTQGIKEARNLENIKNQLIKKGYTNPLVADVHFNPKVAELAATIVEKVRINPGNYTDKKKFETIDLTDKEYQAEIDRIQERFLPLLEICKKNSTAIRIGVNHGSLSDRIINKYGDTPEGMAEAAMEFLRICRKADFNKVVLSMKASNPKIMVYSNRLLVQKMDSDGMSFPVHLGVTEAGEGEDGRIKSAVGIGTLLAEGIGDTIRVSLTEDPELEIPVARTLINTIYYDHVPEGKSCKKTNFKKRISVSIRNIGGDNSPVVIVNSDSVTNSANEKADYFYSDDAEIIKPNKPFIVPSLIWKQLSNKDNLIFPIFTISEYFGSKDISSELNFVRITREDIPVLEKLKRDTKVVLVIEGLNDEGFGSLISGINEIALNQPIIFKGSYKDRNQEDIVIKSSAQLGAPFIDGVGNGIWLKGENLDTLSTSFGILQACGARITKTEFISCPTCGRTSFNITKALKEIKEKTAHFKGLKIAVMGCIVNGPGEMADADYGFIGAGKGKVTLYKGKQPVKKNIDEADAIEELLRLIKEK
ncbi:MAG: (E)-4-hydroxy-3-methylbut-2-enyl-diphosphate synthase [Bacteroidales bacterium]|nr:(E)-4-hydroxy-3-methylbut-2-enyl-diphosphate synthase [Bacteroidales bacterium]